MGKNICLSGILFRYYKDYGATHLNQGTKYADVNNAQPTIDILAA
jgi:hypothetical protein